MQHTRGLEKDAQSAKGSDHLEDLDVDGKMIFKWVLGYYLRIWTGKGHL